MQESDHEGQDGSRRMAGDELNTERVLNRPVAAAHNEMQESALRHKSNAGRYPSRTVTKYNANSPEATIDGAIDKTNSSIPERDSTVVGAGIDNAVSLTRDKIEKKAKRIKLPRNITNVNSLGNVYAVTGAENNNEEAPESYNQAVHDPQWRSSMMNEIRALKNR